MRSSGARAACLALAALLACCRAERPPLNPVSSETATLSACRVAPDGGPVEADRGIGGTGGPAAGTALADRGIGGTGIDRVDGARTGIVGVITGFASVCLAGQEVALPADVGVALESQPAGLGALRAGQVAIVEAAAAPGGLRARRIVIRYEVIGPVERVEGDRLRVAGQSIVRSAQTWGVRPAVGDWVAVSGLRQDDGVIEATRIAMHPAGDILVRGKLVEQADGLRIASLPVRRDPATAALVGQSVTVTGVAGPSGEMVPLAVVPDLLAVDPASFFGPRVGVVLIESFAVLDAGRLRLAPGYSAPAPGLRFEGRQRGVFRFERVGGGLRAVGLAEPQTGFDPTPSALAPRYEPAPVPNRAIRVPGRPDGAGAAGNRGAAGRGRFGQERGQRGPDAPDAPPSLPPGFGPHAR